MSGATTPGASVFQLPPVELPGLNVPGGDLLHKGVVPLILPPGETGYGAIQVGPDAELRIQGPATVEMSSLVLDARASLVIDATAGPVEIFIKKEIVLNSGSTVTTTTEDPTQVTLQVAAADKKKTSVQLNASTSFFGYLYAPEAHVEMNSGFEIYGGLACNAATFNKGARIHVDAALSAGGTGSTGGPEVLTWRVIDIPETVPLSVKNPFDALGVDADALPMPDQAHAATWLQVKWVDLAGDTQSFEGWDTDFDWSIVDGPLKSLKVYDGPALSKVLYFKGSK